MTQNTKVLEEAYKKIIASKELQMKFMEAAKDNKLETFLKEENIEATPDEVKEYLTKKLTNENGELSKEDLDLAAGGEKDTGKWIALSILSAGFGCAASAIAMGQTKDDCLS